MWEMKEGEKMIKIREIETGDVYSSDMSEDNKKTILSIDFCTSYTEVEVQDEVLEEDASGLVIKKYPTKCLIAKPIGSKVSFIDMIAVQELGECEFI
jgi:hypothetical protein